jgi:hypothetical protein
MIINDELGRMWKELVVAYSKLQLRNVSAGNGEASVMNVRWLGLDLRRIPLAPSFYSFITSTYNNEASSTQTSACFISSTSSTQVSIKFGTEDLR